MAISRQKRRRTTLVVTAAAALTAAISVAANTFITGTACAAMPASPMTLCNSWAVGVDDGAYTVQNNEYNSSASECSTTDGNADFTIANSAISNQPGGAPGAYPFIYKGCDYGACTRHSGFPVEVADMSTGAVTSSWSTTQPGADGGDAYDVAYDIWFNQTETTSGQPDGAELMIWLNHNGGVRPFGARIAGSVDIGGNVYDVFEGRQVNWNTISYELVSGTTSVSGLDVDEFTRDSVDRGYIQKSWYLLNVEAGFELWTGGAGLATDSFSVNVAGADGGAANQNTVPTNAPTTPDTLEAAGPGGSAKCAA